MKFGKSSLGSLNSLFKRLDAFLSCKRLLPCIGAGQRAAFDETTETVVPEKPVDIVPTMVVTKDEQRSPAFVEGDGQRPYVLTRANPIPVAADSTSTLVLPSPVTVHQEPQKTRRSGVCSGVFRGYGASTSNPTRAPRKRAVLIGICYTTEKDKGWCELPTASKDVRKVEKLLKQKGYTEFRILSDSRGTRRKDYRDPTRDEIMDALQWLVEDVQAGDRLFLLYSGHGDQVKVQKNDYSEPDGRDEAIVPLNCDGNYITDNELHRILVDPIRRTPESQLIALFDCCHSGTMLDIFHEYTVDPSSPHTDRSGNISNRTPFPLRRRISMDYSPPDRLWNGEAIFAELPKKTQKPSLNTLLHLESIIAPCPDKIVAKIVPENQRKVKGGGSSPTVLISTKRQSTHSSQQSNKRKRTQDSDQSSSPRQSPSASHPPSRGLVESPEPASNDGHSGPRRCSFDFCNRVKMGLTKASTFAHFNDSKVASGRVFAIAACKDEQVVFDGPDGGILSSAFVDYVSKTKEQESTVPNLVHHIWDYFKNCVNNMHNNCQPDICLNGNCSNQDCTPLTALNGLGCGDHDCALPLDLEPPVPFVTSLTDMNKKTKIWL